MKPIKIHYANKKINGIDVVVEIELSTDDKKALHDFHLKNGYEDYAIDDISFIVWIYVDNNGIVYGYSYSEASYYPAEQGETYYDNNLLPSELEQECIQFVKDNSSSYEIL